MQVLRDVLCLSDKKINRSKVKENTGKVRQFLGKKVGTLTLVSFCLRCLRSLCVTNPVLFVFFAKTEQISKKENCQITPHRKGVNWQSSFHEDDGLVTVWNCHPMFNLKRWKCMSQNQVRLNRKYKCIIIENGLYPFALSHLAPNLHFIIGAVNLVTESRNKPQCVNKWQTLLPANIWNNIIA